jgi:hypothetical protein
MTDDERLLEMRRDLYGRLIRAKTTQERVNMLAIAGGPNCFNYREVQVAMDTLRMYLYPQRGSGTSPRGS